MAYLDNNGLAYLWGKIKSYVGEQSGGSHVHTVYSADKSVAITANNKIDSTPAYGASVTLPPGRYIILARGVFNTGTTSGTRNNGLAVYYGSNPTNATILGNSMVRVNAASQAWSSMTTSVLVNPTATTVYTVGLCSSIASSSASTHIDAVLIPDTNSSGVEASHIGQIIHSTTLDTMEKVIEVYGGTTWIRHEGYMLRGASSGVTSNSAVSDGGAATVTLTAAQSGVGSHGHNVNVKRTNITVNSGGNTMLLCHSSNGGTAVAEANGAGYIGHKSAAASSAHNNMPPYKNVYIWERTA